MINNFMKLSMKFLIEQIKYSKKCKFIQCLYEKVKSPGQKCRSEEKISTLITQELMLNLQQKQENNLAC